MERDNYYELIVKVDEQFIDFIAEFIANISDGVEISSRGIVVRGEDDISYIVEEVNSFIKSLGINIDIDYKIEQKENVDWIERYKASIEPIEVGRFYIYPSWYEPKEGKINIKIDPALAFGSGHHATTYSSLEAIDRYVKPDNLLLDVGCGSGILALASRKVGATVDLCDTDPVAVDSARENFALNGEEYNRLWEGSVNMAKDIYSVVVANIVADVLKIISKDLKRVLKSGGVLILSGILDKKEGVVADSYSDLELLERVARDEWVTLIYRKR